MAKASGLFSKIEINSTEINSTSGWTANDSTAQQSATGTKDQGKYCSVNGERKVSFSFTVVFDSAVNPQASPTLIASGADVAGSFYAHRDDTTPIYAVSTLRIIDCNVTADTGSVVTLQVTAEAQGSFTHNVDADLTV